MNRYTYEFISTCPINKENISYKLTIETTETILVEKLKQFLQEKHSKSFHESIAQELACSFPGNQYLCAHHHGVLIETWRS